MLHCWRGFVHLLALGCAGAVLGLLDAWWAVTREGLEQLEAGAREAGLLLGGGLGMGALLGVGCLAVPLASGLARVLPRVAARRWLRTRAGRWTALAMALGVSIAGATLLARRPIEWGAVDWRVPGLVVAAASSYLTIVRFLRGRSAGLVLALGAALLAASGAGLWSYLVLGAARAEGLARVGTEASVARELLAWVRWAGDRDGDGYARWACQADCDCDDQDPSVHPGARDLPEDGRDQDCSGADLSGATASRLQRLVAPPPAAAPPVPPPAAAAPVRPPSLVLIVIDTLRADHLGCYGYRRRPTSPRLDRFAEGAVVFDQARSTGPSTRFSVPPLLIGRYFTEIRRSRGVWPILSDEETLLAERLQAAGYHTAAFHTVRYFLPEYGWAQGFDHYDTTALEARYPVMYKGTSDYLTDRALAYADAGHLSADAPFFLWVYYGDPHSPYVEHPEVARFGEQDRDLYDAEVRFTDEHLGRLLDGLEARGLTRDAVVVVTSDHGEALSPKADHGHKHHSATLYDELVRVPLLVSGSGLTPRRVATSISLLDLPATVLDLAALPPDPALRGVSLVPWLHGEDRPHPPVFFEKHRTWDEPQKGMVHWPYKVIRGFTYEFLRIYDLAQDPHEQRDLTRALPSGKREELEGMLLYWQSEVLRPAPGNPRN